MSTLENGGKTSISTKPEIKKNRRTCQRAEHYKTWDFSENPRCAFWKTLGKRVCLRSQESRKIVGLAYYLAES